MGWTIFITAPTVSVTQIHKAIISLEDYEHDGQPSWTLLYNTAHLDSEAHDLDNASIPPLDLGAEILDASNNAFAGKTPDEIFAFIEANDEKLGANGLTNSDWLIIDERGFKAETCLVCVENNLDEDEDEEAEEEDGEDEDGIQKDKSPFMMARLPWFEAWGMFANIDISNMGFDEWVDEEKGKDADGEYTWVGPFSDEDNADEDVVKRRERALEEARTKGIID